MDFRASKSPEKEKSMQRSPPYLKWKQYTSFVTTVTIFPKSKSRERRSDMKWRRKPRLELLQESSQAPFSRDTPPVSGSEHQRLALALHAYPQACHICSISQQLREAPAEACTPGVWARAPRRPGGAPPGEPGKPGAARQQLTILKAHVTGQRAAFQERGPAAAQPRRFPEPRASPSSRGAQEAAGYWACSALPRGEGLSTGHFSSWFEKGRMEKCAEGEI